MSLAAADGAGVEFCVSLPRGTSGFGSGFTFTVSALGGGGGGGVLGGSVAKSPVSKIVSPSMGWPGTIT